MRVRADREPVGDPSRFRAFLHGLVPVADRRWIRVADRFLTPYR